MVPLPIDESPEHSLALGRLLAHWAVLERLLIFILKYLLDIDWYRAKIVYEEFTSTRGKIKMLKRLNHFWNLDEAMKKEIDDYLNRASKLNSERNAFIHSLWGASSWSGDTLHLGRQKTISPPNFKKSYNPVEMITPQDIDKVVNDIIELSESLTQWACRVLPIPQQ